MQAWRRYGGWDRNGRMAKVKAPQSRSEWRVIRAMWEVGPGATFGRHPGEPP